MVTSGDKSSLDTRFFPLQFAFQPVPGANMTKAADLFGMRLQNFLDNQETKEYMDILNKHLTNSKGSELIDAKKGRYGGSFAHPKLAVFFARWLDVGFSVWCDAVIEDILTQKAELKVVDTKNSAVVATEAAGVPKHSATPEQHHVRHHPEPSVQSL